MKSGRLDGYPLVVRIHGSTLSQGWQPEGVSSQASVADNRERPPGFHRRVPLPAREGEEMTSENYRKKHWIRLGYSWILAVPPVLVTLGLFLSWYILKPNDLFLNLATESAGIVFTLIVVNQLLRYQSSRWYAPVKDVAISQVCEIITRHVEFLAWMYK